MRKKQIVFCIIVSFGICMLAGFLLMRMEYRNYQDKMEIVYVMVSDERSKEDNFILATQILKGEKEELLAEARELFENHGYTDSYMNIYKKMMHTQWVAIVSLCGILYVCFLSFLYHINRCYQKRRTRELDVIQEMTSVLRWEDYPSNILADEQRNLWEDDRISRIQSDFESLASYINMTKQNARLEKEGTKSLVTDISHQLKTPVAALKTSFDILRTPNLTPAEKEEFEVRCQEQIVRLEELVAALVNISRMETGMIEIHKKNGRVFDTVLSSMNRIYPRAQEKEIEIAMEFPDAKEHKSSSEHKSSTGHSYSSEDDVQKLELAHDEKWLSEAIINILENAVKYSPSHSVITIRMMQMTTFLRIEIEDEGIGIPREERNKVFQRFYRGSAKEVSEQNGSGVGLYLAREILDMHQGTLSVSSRHAKKGCVFVLQLLY